jgi:competence protein ComFC
MWIKAKNFILDVLFPKTCFNCKREGDYLCQDCQALLDISGFHRPLLSQNIDDLYWACDYKNPLIAKLIGNFKHEPFVRELGKTLCSLIVAHLQLADNKPDFSEFTLIPVPLDKKRLRWRGFNQAEELGKELADFLKIPLAPANLVRVKEIKEDMENAFICQYPEKIKEQKILLVDDLYLTGSTMAECAKVLKKAGARKIIGITVARG